MVPLPCGQCEHCRAALANKWTNRLQFESKDWRPDEILFITLTYSDEYLPQNGDLSKRDLNLFRKRLRIRKGAFRYFNVGEYGDKRFRPHYHLITFGITKDCNRSICRFNAKTCNCSFYKAWQKKGRIEVEYIRSSKKGMKYVTGYCFKKRTRKEDKMLRGHLPEFKTQSTKPPLGEPYILRRIEQLKNSYGNVVDRCVDSVRIGKRTIPLDRHLKRKAFEIYHGSTDILDTEFQNFAWENFANSYDPTGETTFHTNCIKIKEDERKKREANRRKHRKKRRLDNA